MPREAILASALVGAAKKLDGHGAGGHHLGEPIEQDREHGVEIESRRGGEVELVKRGLAFGMALDLLLGQLALGDVAHHAHRGDGVCLIFAHGEGGNTQQRRMVWPVVQRTFSIRAGCPSVCAARVRARRGQAIWRARAHRRH